MTERLVTIQDAARVLRVSMDTLRRWDRAGKLRTVRDAANHRMVPQSEVERLAPMRTKRAKPQTGSARNRLECIVTHVDVDGFLARVELEVVDPARLVAVITREAAEQLQLTEGASATAVVKATSMMVEAAP